MSEKALFWLSESDWEQAEQAFSCAADLAASDGRHDLEAQARYAQALVLERSPEGAEAARAAYARAEQLFAEQGQTERVASIRDRLAQAPAPAFAPDAPESWQAWLAQLGDRLQSSIDALYDALASASADERAQLEASRAKLFWLAGETEPMAASLEAAIAAARDSSNPELIANIDALRRTLFSLRSAIGRTVGRFRSALGQRSPPRRAPRLPPTDAPASRRSRILNQLPRAPGQKPGFSDD